MAEPASQTTSDRPSQPNEYRIHSRVTGNIAFNSRDILAFLDII